MGENTNLTGALKGKKGTWAKFNPLIRHINREEELETMNLKTPSSKKFIYQLAEEDREEKGHRFERPPGNKQTGRRNLSLLNYKKTQY